MKTAWREWLVVGVLLATTLYVVAEEISLTTYHPSPKGAYQTLSSTSTSHFATYEGGVGIGIADPGTANLAVMGGNVGIGTTDPKVKLHIQGAEGTAFSDTVRISSPGYYYAELDIQTKGGSGGGGINFNLSSQTGTP